VRGVWEECHSTTGPTTYLLLQDNNNNSPVVTEGCCETLLGSAEVLGWVVSLASSEKEGSM